MVYLCAAARRSLKERKYNEISESAGRIESVNVSGLANFDPSRCFKAVCDTITCTLHPGVTELTSANGY